MIVSYIRRKGDEDILPFARRDDYRIPSRKLSGWRYTWKRCEAGSQLTTNSCRLLLYI